MFRLHVEAVDVTEPAIPGFRHDRQRPLDVGLNPAGALPLPGNHRVTRHADAVRIREHNRTFEKTRFLNPRGAGHLAVAVECKHSGKYRRGTKCFATRKYCRDAGAHRTAADLEFSLT